MTEIVFGYDPGGDGSHGVALLQLDEGRATALTTRTLRTAEEVVSTLEGLPALRVLRTVVFGGVDLNFLRLVGNLDPGLTLRARPRAAGEFVADLKARMATLADNENRHGDEAATTQKDVPGRRIL